MTQKRCEICHDWFEPQARAPHQRCCSKPACRKKRKAIAKKRWWLSNPDYGKSRKQKICAWAKEYPDYWRKYRREHFDYAEKERRRMRSVRQKAKSVAKQDAVRGMSVKKLESIRDLGADFVAKQDAVNRRVDGILDYLFWKETIAKQDAMEDCLCRAP